MAARAILGARSLSAFTGAGISVESGIPPFRGKEGLWSRYDPRVLDIEYFNANPEDCWPVIREIFYDFFGKAQPNRAHLLLAELEHGGFLKHLITQNIDDLHYRAGSRNVIEFHGNSRRLLCRACGRRYEVAEVDLRQLPPRCGCGSILKPDFVFFGEGIPRDAFARSEECAAMTDVMLLIGTTGEVYPAAQIPQTAAARGALIIEINPERSAYTDRTTGLFLPLGAVEALSRIDDLLREER